MRGLIVAAMVALPCCFACSGPPPTRAKVDFAVAFATPQPHTVAVSVPNDKTFYAEREPVLTERHIKFATVFRSEGNPVLIITFTPDGSRILQRVSGANVGNYLVMSVETTPILALKITAPIPDGMARLQSHLHTEEELRALASKMRGW